MSLFHVSAVVTLADPGIRLERGFGLNHEASNPWSLRRDFVLFRRGGVRGHDLKLKSSANRLWLGNEFCFGAY